jgi:hypothetical protein
VTWIKIDDSFPNHPKVIGLSDRAFRTHITGLCYCGTYLTDGFIPYAAVNAIVKEPEYKPTDELEAVGLWKRTDDGFIIHDYLSHQTSKEEVEHKRELSRKRSERYRTKKESETVYDWGDASGNALVTHPEDRIQNTEYINQNTEITTSKAEISKKADEEKSGFEGLETGEPYLPTLPRVASAKRAVEAVSLRLDEARRGGINAWNLSRLIEDEWDKLHTANDIGGCIALTAWYVSELQSRNLSSVEIARIGQMTKRFGRIALIAIDEAASKNLDDLVSYAFRIAQNEYAKRQGK